MTLSLRLWIKRRNSPLSRTLYTWLKTMRGMSMPVIPLVHSSLYRLHRMTAGFIHALLRIFYHTPLLQSRLKKPAAGLYLYGGLPLILGGLDLEFGRDCRISGQTTFSGRSTGTSTPKLKVGRNVDIGWQTTIAVGRQVILGDHVRIAGRAFLAGYPGHPLEAGARAKGAPDTEAQIGDIILEDHVWLATNVTILAGVTIGEGTIIAAGSVVTKSLPPYVLAAGVPARIIRSLKEARNAA